MDSEILEDMTITLESEQIAPSPRLKMQVLFICDRSTIGHEFVCVRIVGSPNIVWLAIGFLNPPASSRHPPY